MFKVTQKWYVIDSEAEYAQLLEDDRPSNNYLMSMRANNYRLLAKVIRISESSFKKETIERFLVSEANLINQLKSDLDIIS